MEERSRSGRQDAGALVQCPRASRSLAGVRPNGAHGEASRSGDDEGATVTQRRVDRRVRNAHLALGRRKERRRHPAWRALRAKL